MMPHTVPNRPTNGAVEPMVASTPVPLLMLRPHAATRRSRRKLTRSLMPSFSRLLADRRISSRASCTSKWARVPSLPAVSLASFKVRAFFSWAISLRRRRLAPRTSKPLAIQIVQVMIEAIARPIITILTMMSAFLYMPQGDRSWAMPRLLSSSATICGALSAGAAAPSTSVGSVVPGAATGAGAAASVAACTAGAAGSSANAATGANIKLNISAATPRQTRAGLEGWVGEAVG
ncbi:hypothetical protein PS685_04448 [Pseudomonas fluorescens]|uniref:Uncharacterized protein n=1 Tax=Pseudomonas fluorescens TaxID=294 RepID=A0A5E6ZEE2_PSEFL|nr:hypothetical protein PS685_04448 [Pseudomonas fluorescens]